MITSRWFKEEEFKRCSPACSLQDMSQEFMDLLDKVRDEVGFPVKLNSAYRTKEHDLKKGRTGTGPHTFAPCEAVDIACTESARRFELVRTFLNYGVVRIGIAKTFIHVDISKRVESNHVQCLIWLY